MTRLNSAAKDAGTEAEADARWYIDRTFHQSKNWRALHDVLLKDPRSDSWCQIDHLAFGRLGCFLVMETKSAVEGVTLHPQSGAWNVLHNGRPKPIKSPIHQNLRHIEVLKHFLEQEQVMPKRLMISIRPAFENWILVQPGARLPVEYDGAKLVQRDQFNETFKKFVETSDNLSMLKLMSSAELDAIAARLEAESSQNKRLRDVSQAKDNPQSAAQIPSRTYRPTACAKCARDLTVKEYHFCRFNFDRLNRQFLCRACQ